MKKTEQSFFFFLLLLPIELSAQKNSAEALLKWRDSLVSHSLNSWSIANGSSTSSPCNWTGIQCDEAGSVVEINLPSSGLDGTLEEFEFSAFPNLTSLNLDMNNLIGSLPVRIGNLSKLNHLDLGSNQFTNAIPAEVGSLSELRFLRLFDNSFTGAIPYQLTNLQKERVASLYEDNPSIAKKDLDHDAVAFILGRDNRGRVKGMGDKVSKTSIKYSDPYKKALQKEQESQVILQAQVENLEKRLLEVESRDLRREMEAMFGSLSQANTEMRPSTECGSSSQGSQSSQSLAAHLDQTITHTRGQSLCKLQHMTKKNIIAYGRLQGTELSEAGFYRIVLDEIVDGNVDLFDGERKLGDVILGDVLDWPIIRTILY